MGDSSMKTITIEITDLEKKSLEFMGDEDIQQWLQQAVQARAHKAKLDIADRFRKFANRENIQIPNDLDLIVEQAHKHGLLRNQS